MEIYEQMYLSLFVDITSAINKLEGNKDSQLESVINILQEAQKKTEDMYIKFSNH